ncbi:hypothetical protein ACGGZK_00365 [Agromyces sp. MMS24-K17]|uniref:type IV toxin-antitoxin system AbiEi family antitoxin domain-containing protein n=1 Tax=Agromyces sp. MMS24-K17 TaxID=3372850 RepID=UPI003754A061
MIDALDVLAAMRPTGLILAADLRRGGLHSSGVRRLVGLGRLVEVRRGCYAAPDRWEAATPDERYRLRIHAAAMAGDEPFVVSHQSAAALHRLPSIGRWPEAVHTTDTDATGGRRGTGRIVHRAGPEPETVVIDGLVVTSLARTLADLAISTPMAGAVTFLDAALHRVATSPAVSAGAVGEARGARAERAAESMREAISAELAAIGPFHGRRRADASVVFADHRAETPGESLSRVRMFELGFEIPELQVRVDGVLGSYAVLDFLWRGIRRLGEFDGRMKYTRSREVSGLEASDVVYREKLREDALRRKGFSVTRWNWSVLQQPAAFAALLREAGVPQRG